MNKSLASYLRKLVQCKVTEEDRPAGSSELIVVEKYLEERAADVAISLV